jgi:hypothetical protein
MSSGEVFASFQLALNTVGALLARVLRPLEREGKLTPMSVMPPYRPLAEYAPAFAPTVPKTGEPLLDDPIKPGRPGFRNFNALGYLELSKRIRVDAVYVLTRYPGWYLRRIGKKSVEQYFLAAECHPPMFPDYPNRVRIGGWSRVFSRGLLLQPSSDRPSVLLFLLFLLIPAAWFAAIVQMFGAAGIDSRDSRHLVGFMAFNIFYISAVTIFLTGAELNRYRFFVDPFFLVLSTLAMQKVVVRLRSVVRRRLDASNVV